MSELAYFLWEHKGDVATITFNRPEKRNGIDLRVMLELESLIHRVRDADDIKILILTGTGPAFCAGADFTLLRDASSDAERAQVERDMAKVPRILGRLYDVLVHMDVISIAAVNGHAVGGGWTIALAFDHVLAVEQAQFWLPEVELGQPFRGLANVKLTQRLGPALAKEAMILCRRFSANELFDLHVINQVCAPNDLAAETQRIAQAYLKMPWRAAISTRRDIQAVTYGPQYF